jgi:hypothetical protein
MQIICVSKQHRKFIKDLGVVAHAWNPSYFGDGDQEDQGSRPAQTKR